MFVLKNQLNMLEIVEIVNKETYEVEVKEPRRLFF